MGKSIIINILFTIILSSTLGCSKNDLNIKEMGPIEDGDYYVATWGNDNDPGTFDKPFATWQKAVTVSVPGNITYIRGGLYQPTTYINSGTMGMLIRPKSNVGLSGTREAPICYFAYPGETPILDGSLLSPDKGWMQGITVEYAQYIHFKGLTVRNIKQDNTWNAQAMGIATVPCANMRFENCNVHDIGGRAFYYSSGAWNSWDGADAPFTSDSTYWINCDAYNLCDSLAPNPGNAADGWKCHGYQGNYLYWEGCRAWNYSDDGIDPSGECYKIIKNCWLMSTSNYLKFGMEGNGIKISAPRSIYYFPDLLSDKILVRVTNCLAAYCVGGGFNNNLFLDDIEFLSNNGVFLNNTAYKCLAGFYEGTKWKDPPIIRTTIHKNNLSYSNTSELYGQAQIYYPSIYTAINNTWIPTMEPFGWPGWKYNPAFNVSNDDFVSIIPGGLTAPRNQDGSLPDISFLKLKDNSDLKGAGVDVGMSSKPDIGIDWAYLKTNNNNIY